MSRKTDAQRKAHYNAQFATGLAMGCAMQKMNDDSVDGETPRAYLAW